MQFQAVLGSGSPVALSGILAGSPKVVISHGPQTGQGQEDRSAHGVRPSPSVSLCDTSRRHYSVDMARSVWIASPVSHAKPIATVARWKRPPKDTRTATWLNAALARPKKTSIITAEPVE